VASGIDCRRRPETLTVEEFVRLLHALPADAVAARGADTTTAEGD
jgi:hypothetical protein